MKDLWKVSYFLGLEVTSSSNDYYLLQTEYSYELLSKVGLTDSKTISNLLEVNTELTSINGDPFLDATLYHQLVGSLIYPRHLSRHVVHLISQFMTAPRSTHNIIVL